MPTVHPHAAPVFQGLAGSLSCQMVNMMVDGEMAKHGLDPKPNIPRDVACFGCQHRKGIRNIKVHTALRCADSHPHDAAVVEGLAGSQSCQMVNMMVDG